MQRFHTIPTSKNASKYDISDSKEDNYHGVPIRQIMMLEANDFAMKTLHCCFFFEFFENRLKSNSWWIAQKRFSKKVKQVLQRRRGEGRSCNRTAKENKMNYYENSYCRHFHDILSEFCLNGVFMNGFQLLWLLRSGKVVRYKIDIPIPDPWI